MPGDTLHDRIYKSTLQLSADIKRTRALLAALMEEGDRDDSRKIHDRPVPWKELPDDIKRYDRDAVRAFPEILSKAKLEVRRLT